MTNSNPTVEPFSAEHLIEDIRQIGNHSYEDLRDEYKSWEDSANASDERGNEKAFDYARAMMNAITELMTIAEGKAELFEAQEKINLAGYRLGQAIGKYTMARGE